MQIRNETNYFCKFLGNSVCLKSGYRKRKGGLKTGYRKQIGVSNMVSEEQKGLKFGYGNKLGFQIWLQKQIGVSKMVTKKILCNNFWNPNSFPVTSFEALFFSHNHFWDPDSFPVTSFQTPFSFPVTNFQTHNITKKVAKKILFILYLAL